MLASSASPFGAAPSDELITISDDEDFDIEDEPLPRPQQPAGDDDESFFDADDGDAEAEDGADWGDMAEVNDEADIDALPGPTHSTAASSSASSSTSSRRTSAYDAFSVESCPRDVMRRIEADVREIGALPSFCASDVNFGGRTRVALRVGFPVRSLGMSAEQVRAWYDTTGHNTTHARHGGTGTDHSLRTAALVLFVM